MASWITCTGTVNSRDTAGLSGSLGRIADGVLWRSDNLQDLTREDCDSLTAAGLSDVVDLRSVAERRMEGPTPLQQHGRVAHHAFSLLPDDDVPVPLDQLPGEAAGDAASPLQELPPVDSDHRAIRGYVHLASHRTDSIVAALRTIAAADGATLVHCAAGKDRTGIVVAFALLLAGVDRDQVIDDYAASVEKNLQILERLSASPTYADALRGTDPASHEATPDILTGFLAWVDRVGGIESLLARAGWTADDTSVLRAKLLA